MREKKANILLQYFFKLTKMDGISFNGTAHYQGEPEETILSDRLHECFHLAEQSVEGKVWYIKYFIQLLFGYHDHIDEVQAKAFARQKVSEKNLTAENYCMSDTDYVQKCYKEAKIQLRNT